MTNFVILRTKLNQDNFRNGSNACAGERLKTFSRRRGYLLTASNSLYRGMLGIISAHSVDGTRLKEDILKLAQQKE